MDQDAARDSIIPCDPERPYAFISYSSQDADVVYEDVLELQKRGYNIWIDAHLDKNKPSWRDDAHAAIENLNCEVLVYYVSRNSLVSGPCREELLRTRSGTARARRLGRDVRLLVVEAESIDNLVSLSEWIQNDLWRNASLTADEKGKRLETMYYIRTEFLNDNDRVRIHARKSRPGMQSYFSELERDLNKSRRSIRLSDHRIYRCALGYILQDQNRYGAMLLERVAGRYVPAALLLAYLYGNRRSSLYQSGYDVMALWDRAEKIERSQQWLVRAGDCQRGKFYSEALAYYLGYGERYADSDSLFRASQMWIGLGSRGYALMCLGEARELGNNKAIQFYENVQRASDAAISKQAFRDEACVN